MSLESFESLELLQTLEGHDERVWCVAWSPDGSTLASCSADKTVRLWAPGPGAPPLAAAGAGAAAAVAPLVCSAVLEDSHTKTIRCAAWSNDGRHLATAGFDGLTAVWERQGGVWESVATLEGHESEVKCVAWSPNDGALATCGRDKSVWLWEHLPGNDFECLDVKPGHGGDVKAVAWHPGGELLASCSYDDSIKIWAPEPGGGGEWECAQTLAGPSGHSSTVWSVAFSPDGRQMASAGDDKTLRVWECRFGNSSDDGGGGGGGGGGSRRPSFRLAAAIGGYHSRSIFSCSWSADGRWLASGDGANCIRVFTRGDEAAAAAAGGGGADGGGCGWVQACAAEAAHESDVNSVAWHPSDATLLASGGDDGRVRLWRLRAAGGGGGGRAVMAED
ncbi:hypothetical protein Rsub_13247 [Raphidocelis subcapitata]|uniref:Probable cytosolic iron-sulfur protein assembly protein CIAO1 homolog n=1 Tax=Raphidocelis subcapitata TaxID=307507 RepID=A0A2V0PR28_9CHLO|nr:hypothetical protein Rsub_13247 [Raphidocelis subcapitata]|eukprot:GBG00551.1 hypothetical protein Rsub_13247 [Raphidocelis subcapitata]